MVAPARARIVSIAEAGAPAFTPARCKASVRVSAGGAQYASSSFISHHAPTPQVSYIFYISFYIHITYIYATI
jgi:hypothetical protein